MKLALSDRSVDLASGIVSNGKMQHRLTSIERDLLHYLSQHPEVAVSRHTLHQEVWGYNLRVVTRAVDSCVKRLRRKIEADPANPRHLVTVYSVGYQLVVAEGPEAAAPNALPPPTTRCIGRDDLIEALTHALERAHAVVSLTGPGGIGKSLVARTLLSDSGRVAALELSKVVRLPLGEATSVSDAVDALARRLGRPVHASHLDTWTDLANTALLGRTLLFVDDADASPTDVHTLIQRAREANPDLRVLVTSRERMPMPTAHQLRVGPLSDEDSVAVFEGVLQRVGPSTPLPREDLREMTQVLEGVPLALELAAEHVGLLAPAELLARLQTTPLALRSALQRDPRHQSLDQVVSTSWERLNAEEQSAVSQLSVFASAFRAEAAEAILEGVGPALLMLQRLRDRSLLLTVPDRPGHLRLLSLVRQYCAAHEQDDRSAAAARHAAWVHQQGRALLSTLLESAWPPNVATASRWAPNDEVVASLAALEADLEAAIDRNPGPANAHAERALILDALWTHRGHLDRREAILTDALTQREAIDDAVTCRLLAGLGAVYFLSGSLGRANDLLIEAYSLGSDRLDVHQVTICRSLATISSWLGDNEQAREWLHRARAAAEALARPDLMRALWYDQGRLDDRQGEIAASRACFTEMLQLSTDHSDRLGEAYAHYCLAYSFLNHNDTSAADDHIRKSIAAQSVAGTSAISGVHTIRAQIALANAEEDTAEGILVRSLVASKQRGDLRITAEDLLWLGLTAHLMQRLDEAHALYTDASTLAVHGNAPIIATYARCLMGAALAENGEPDAGMELLDTAILALQDSGWRQNLDLAGLRLLRAIGLQQHGTRHQAAGRSDRASALQTEIAQLWADVRTPASGQTIAPFDGSMLARLLARLVARTAPER